MSGPAWVEVSQSRLLPEIAILPEHTVLDAGDGYPRPITDTEVALVAAPEARAASRGSAKPPANFCSTLDPGKAARLAVR